MPVRLGVKFGSMENKGVRRCLFGIPDHDELKKELKAQLEQTSSEMKNTWNFDPLLDQPLNGRYEWNLPEKDEYVPSFYTKQYRPTKFRSRRNVLSEIDPKSAGSDLTPPASPILSVPIIARLSPETESDIEAEAIEMKRENETTPEARVVRQTKIPEYMRVKKRRLSEDYSSEDDSRPSKSART
ncbi:cyclin-dependent kinase inhibitor 1B-like [Mercenaria mercenaria]|uniref:cyclin-dependent kinase inhibitor 1B-like n=1 Tax=Mercenaria mercenaria TaxID=6596 RepID=UPI001E1DD7CD|nr:cyclin-dependent kinase inhibitor 1B-like [Mercenaria mercenaria]